MLNPKIMDIAAYYPHNNKALNNEIEIGHEQERET